MEPRKMQGKMWGMKIPTPWRGGVWKMDLVPILWEKPWIFPREWVKMGNFRRKIGPFRLAGRWSTPRRGGVGENAHPLEGGGRGQCRDE